MALLAFAAERRAAVRRAAAPRPLLSIDDAQQQTRRTLLQRSTDGTDRRTDGHRTVTRTLLTVSITQLMLTKNAGHK